MSKFIVTAIIEIESTESEDVVATLVQNVLESIPNATNAYVETLIPEGEEEEDL